MIDDNIGVPEDIVWALYGPYIQLGLEKRGLPADTARYEVEIRGAAARSVLTELQVRAVRPPFSGSFPTVLS